MLTARDNRIFLANEVKRLTTLVEEQEKTIKELNEKLTGVAGGSAPVEANKPWKKQATVKDTAVEGTD